MKLSVVIPVYNERSTIEEIVRRVRAVDLNKEIIIVDDYSTDGTRDVLRELSAEHVMVEYHARNRGKGAAVRTGLAKATGDIVLIQDADLEYDPDDYHKLIQPILRGKAQVVYGSRFLGEHKAMFFWHMVGNKLLTFVTNVLYDTTLTDMETCYKVFTIDVVRRLTLTENRFEIEPEITAKVLRMGIRIYEVPISYAGRETFEGKKITWRDGFPALWTLVKYRFHR